ncbi:hypothetical protein EGM51_17185 [Verrucomicrobia bacterium S94]|nr:hypothetical protein EGM51_17185 [Verrucomicrobia bacterium S94]
MKTFHTAADALRLSGFCIGFVLSASGGFVTETEQELITRADLDGDGRQDIVVVDKSSGTFRAGYQISSDLFTWSESRSLGATNITGLATGPITDVNYDSIAAVTPFMNRIHLIEAAGVGTPAYPLPVFGNEIGPETVVSLPIGAGTPESDLIVINSLGSSNPNRLERIESSGSSFTPLGSHTISDAWERGNSVLYTGNQAAAVFLDRSNNALRMYEFSTGTIHYLDSLFFNSALTAPDYCPIHPVSGGYIHYIAWDPGTSSAYRFYMQPGDTFSTLDAVDFGGDIRSIQTVQAKGSDWLLIFYTNGEARVFAYDGVNDPIYDHDIASAGSGIFYSAALQIGSDRFVLLSADEATGRSLTAERFEFADGTFQGDGPLELPAVTAARGRANVFTFVNEPFVNPQPQRLQTLNAGDWSSRALLTGGPVQIEADYEIDQGLPDGLGNTDTAVLGLADISAQHTLVNQAGIPYSIYSTEAAAGDQWAEAFINPAPGHYRTGIEVTFSNSTGDDIYYRLSDSTVWNLYSSAIPLFKDETILFYAEAPGGQRSPIRSSSYSFEDAPGELDSDSDGIPDYVELANGLNPLTSGLDADGDGFSDLEELLAGSDPAVSSNVPVLPIPGTSGRLEQFSAFDLHISLTPYDGTADSLTVCRTGTTLRAFSGTGWQFGFATASNHAVAGITDPSVLITNMPSTIEAGFFTLLTDQHFPISTSFSNKNIGIEMASVMIPPSFQPLEIPPVYSGGNLASESATWISAALNIMTNSSVPVLQDELNTEDVLRAMLTERKLIDELFNEGFITNRYATIFPTRPSDGTMLSVSANDFSDLRRNTNNAFLPETVIAEIDTYLSDANSAALRFLAQELYDICSEYSDAEPGLYPLPMTVLRNYLLTGTLNSNYAARVTYNSSELTQIVDNATNMLASISPRPVESLLLEVRDGSFSNSCPVLYTTDDAAKSLYDAEGRPYIMPFSFELGAGAEVTALAFTDVSWNRVPGTDPIEIISLNLTAVPVSSDADANGNLIPDALEENLLASPRSPSHLDSDGDGYSDLQEYLDGSDPADPLNTPAGAIVDLSPPEVTVTSLGAGQIQLDIQWPAAYADPFVFTAIYSDDLSTPGFSSDHELAPGTLSTVISTDSSDARFYKVGIHLR